MNISGKLYNVAAAVCDGKLLGFVPKRSLPNYGEFYERRQFTPGFDKCVNVDFDGYSVPLGAKMLFTCVNMPQLVIGAEICEDLWTPQPPSSELAMNGATLLVNCSASNETRRKEKIQAAACERTVSKARISICLCFVRRGRVNAGFGFWRAQSYM